MHKSMTRTRLATWNFASGLLFTAVTTITGLVATPWLVKWLDPVRFGAARMTVEYYGYLTLLEFGLGGTLGPLLARPLGQDDGRAVRRTLAAGIRMYLRVTVLTLAVGLGFALCITRLVPVPPGPVARDLQRAAVVALLGFALLTLAP